MSHYDTLLHQAADLVTETSFASHSFLRRRLRIGLARAYAVLDQLEQAGIVGPPQGAVPRDVLVAPEEAIRLVDAFLREGGDLDE